MLAEKSFEVMDDVKINPRHQSHEVSLSLAFCAPWQWPRPFSTFLSVAYHRWVGMDGKAILEDGEVVVARSTHYLSAASGELVLRFARKATPAAAMQAISPRARVSYLATLLVLCTNMTEVEWSGVA